MSVIFFYFVDCSRSNVKVLENFENIKVRKYDEIFGGRNNIDEDRFLSVPYGK